jgi:hypothetical protein
LTGIREDVSRSILNRRPSSRTDYQSFPLSTCMNIYTISLPGFRETIEASSKKEALEQFWFDFDIAQEDPEWETPIISVTKKKHGR